MLALSPGMLAAAIPCLQPVRPSHPTDAAGPSQDRSRRRSLARGPRSLVVGLLVAALVLVPGCQEPLRPSSLPPDATPVAEPAAPAEIVDKDYWDTLVIENKKVGYSHTRYTTVTEQGRALVRITAESELSVQRFGQSIKQRMAFSSLETPDGRVVRCENSISNETPTAGSADITTRARVEGEKLVLEVATHGKTESAAIPWSASWGGYFATEQTLERRPMKPGERRQLRALMAGFNQVADVEFHAVRYESTPILDGSEDLLRIELKVKIAGTVLDQTVWADSTGQTRKTTLGALDQTTYRTSRSVALGQANEEFDLGAKTVVRIERPLERPHQLRRARYRVQMARGSAAEAFARGATQRMDGLDQKTAEILVRRLRPGDQLGAEFPAEQGPGEAELAANSLVQCDDPQIQELAHSVAPDTADRWEIACALERLVAGYVTNKGFAHALASAADVVRSREGDCTEHAVLLTALCRARGIPARVAIGLIYSAAAEGFAYHMWTEVWIQDRWLPLDATLGLGGIGAAHLKVSQSDLQGVDPFSQFLPVFQLIGNVRIDLISAE